MQLSKGVGWILGLLVLSLGVINLLSGNDPRLSITYIVFSILFYPVTNTLPKDLPGIVIPIHAKIIAAFSDYLGKSGPRCHC